MSELQALFGGTFDPIHFGHLRPVEALAQQTGLQRVTLLPNNVPPHRPQPEASAAQRVDMLRCAIAGLPLFDIDTRELARDTPSWTVTTLEAWRAERGAAQPLGFIIGQDSLLSLASWHRWQDLLSLCHLLVCQRPGYATRFEAPRCSSGSMNTSPAISGSCISSLRAISGWQTRRCITFRQPKSAAAAIRTCPATTCCPRR